MSARSGPRDGPVRGRPRDRDKQLPDPPLRLQSEAHSQGEEVRHGNGPRRHGPVRREGASLVLLLRRGEPHS